MGNIRYKGGNYTRDARSSYVIVEPLSVTENGTYTAESGKAYNRVTVNVEPPKPAVKKDVNFYDYDGTVVASYTKQEFLELAEMPANPTHERLIAQGWNYSLADAKAYVIKYGVLNIGQMYTTASGALEIDIELHEGRLHPYLGLNINGSVTVNWGDGTATDIMTGSSLSTVVRKDHVYAAPGAYTIKIFANDGTSVSIVGTSDYSNVLTHSDSPSSSSPTMGYNSSVVGVYATDFTSIGSYAFNNCYSLVSVIIPDSVTSIGNYAFNSCYSLASVTMSDSVTDISSREFSICYVLVSVTIPDGVTSINGNAFQGCYSLVSVTIPDGVTDIVGNAFQGCRSLSSVTIPDSVTSINSNAFNSCYSLSFIKFESRTPPTLTSPNTWSNIPTDCIIYVPTGTIEAYKAKAYMPDPSTYTYVEYTE